VRVCTRFLVFVLSQRGNSQRLAYSKLDKIVSDLGSKANSDRPFDDDTEDNEDGMPVPSPRTVKKRSRVGDTGSSSRQIKLEKLPRASMKTDTGSSARSSDSKLSAIGDSDTGSSSCKPERKQ
jgi:hypothetical protein